MKRIPKIILLAIIALSLLPGCQTLRVTDPELARIDTVVNDEINAGHIPGAVVLVARSDTILYHKAFGEAVAEPFRAPMRKETVFDLASLTKPIATATAVMILVDRHELALDDHVADYLPAFAEGGKEEVQIQHLLAHTSGLPAYTNANQLKTEFGDPCPEEVINKICSLDAMSAPGETFRYSCLGYITLAEIVKVVSGKDIATFSHDNLFKPLGMRNTRYNPPAGWTRNIAATEIVNDELLRGRVHDPLAQLRDGISGNAGLFSNASDLYIFNRMLLKNGVWKGTQILSPESVQKMITPQSHGRAFGFDVLSAYSWLKGPYASDKAFSHSGYTGTSIVCDPETETQLIILTNRAHPDDGGSVKTVREKLAEIVFSAGKSSTAAIQE